jgi:hypothetical protein
MVIVSLSLKVVYEQTTSTLGYSTLETKHTEYSTFSVEFVEKHLKMLYSSVLRGSPDSITSNGVQIMAHRTSFLRRFT